MATFIAAQRAEQRIPHAASCRALGVSQPWFYKWRHGDPSVRHARREKLAVDIKRLFAQHNRTYGSPRITADLRDEGWKVSVNTVAAIMGELDLGGFRVDFSRGNEGSQWVDIGVATAEGRLIY